MIHMNIKSYFLRKIKKKSVSEVSYATNLLSTLLSVYSKYWDRQALANSIKPDKGSGSTLFVTHPAVFIDTSAL